MGAPGLLEEGRNGEATMAWALWCNCMVVGLCSECEECLLKGITKKLGLKVLIIEQLP